MGKKKYEKTSSEKFGRYSFQAKKLNKEFLISKLDFFNISSQPCFYCGARDTPCNGMDRVNNDLGYTLDNVVSCCFFCNMAKGQFLQSDFIFKCNEIAKKHPVNISEGVPRSIKDKRVKTKKQNLITSSCNFKQNVITNFTVINNH